MNISSKIPKKSTHLEISVFNTDEYLIKQTYYGYQININKRTLDVLELVDGKTNIKNISLLLEKADEISVEVIYDLLYNKLGKYGIIEVESIEVEKRIKPSYLKLSFTLLKKEWIKPIAKFLSPLFSKSIFYPILLVNLIIVLSVLYFNFNILITTIDNLSLYQWSVYIILSGTIGVIHEFGHASSCYKQGAEFGEIGFGFYLFIPVMFADVSDIWKLEPNKRIIVNIAGIYLELIVASVFSILFLIYNNHLFLVFSSITSLTIVANLNPFLRYDGYWILSDLINVPNLRKESNKRVTSLIKDIGIYKKYNFKDFSLTLYGVLSNTIIILVLLTVVISDPYSLLYFPKNLYIYIKSILLYNNFIFSDIYKFILPLLFYYILFKFLIGLIKKSISKKT